MKDGYYEHSHIVQLSPIHGRFYAVFAIRKTDGSANFFKVRVPALALVDRWVSQYCDEPLPPEDGGFDRTRVVAAVTSQDGYLEVEESESLLGFYWDEEFDDTAVMDTIFRDSAEYFKRSDEAMEKRRQQAGNRQTAIGREEGAREEAQ